MSGHQPALTVVVVGLTRVQLEDTDQRCEQAVSARWAAARPIFTPARLGNLLPINWPYIARCVFLTNSSIRRYYKYSTEFKEIFWKLVFCLQRDKFCWISFFCSSLLTMSANKGYTVVFISFGEIIWIIFRISVLRRSFSWFSRTKFAFMMVPWSPLCYSLYSSFVSKWVPLIRKRCINPTVFSTKKQWFLKNLHPQIKSLKGSNNFFGVFSDGCLMMTICYGISSERS